MLHVHNGPRQAQNLVNNNRLQQGIDPDFSSIITKVAAVAATILAVIILPFPINLIAGGLLGLFAFSFFGDQGQPQNGQVHHWHHNFVPQNWFPNDLGLNPNLAPRRVHVVRGHRHQQGPQVGFRAQVGGDQAHPVPNLIRRNAVRAPYVPVQGPQVGLRAQVGGEPDLPENFNPQANQGLQAGNRAKIGVDP